MADYNKNITITVDNSDATSKIGQTKTALNGMDSTQSKITKTVKGTTEQFEKQRKSIIESGGAVGVLNELTGGLASTFKDVFEAIEDGGLSLKKFSGLMAGLGIGALLLIVQYWEQISEFIGLSNKSAEASLETQRQMAKESANAVSTQQNLLDVVLDTNTAFEVRLNALNQMAKVIPGIEKLALSDPDDIKRLNTISKIYAQILDSRGKVLAKQKELDTLIEGEDDLLKSNLILSNLTKVELLEMEELIRTNGSNQVATTTRIRNLYNENKELLNDNKSEVLNILNIKTNIKKEIEKENELLTKQNTQINGIKNSQLDLVNIIKERESQLEIARVKGQDTYELEKEILINKKLLYKNDLEQTRLLNNQIEQLEARRIESLRKRRKEEVLFNNELNRTRRENLLILNKFLSDLTQSTQDAYNELEQIFNPKIKPSNALEDRFKRNIDLLNKIQVDLNQYKINYKKTVDEISDINKILTAGVLTSDEEQKYKEQIELLNERLKLEKELVDRTQLSFNQIQKLGETNRTYALSNQRMLITDSEEYAKMYSKYSEQIKRVSELKDSGYLVEKMVSNRTLSFNELDRIKDIQVEIDGVYMDITEKKNVLFDKLSKGIVLDSDDQKFLKEILKGIKDEGNKLSEKINEFTGIDKREQLSRKRQRELLAQAEIEQIKGNTAEASSLRQNAYLLEMEWIEGRHREKIEKLREQLEVEKEIIDNFQNDVNLNPNNEKYQLAQASVLDTQKELNDAVYEQSVMANDKDLELKKHNAEQTKILEQQKYENRLSLMESTMNMSQVLYSAMDVMLQNEAKSSLKARKAMLAIQKGLAIADVWISFARGNASIAAGEARFGAEGGIPGAVAGAAWGGVMKVLNLTTAIASTAMIVKQGLDQSKAMNASSVKSGGTPTLGSAPRPNFSIVSDTGQNSLARTIANQQKQPIETFVVGKSVTTQQELDRNKIKNATLI